MDIVETWLSLEKEILVAIPRFIPDHAESLHTVHVSLRRVRKALEILQTTNLLVVDGTAKTCVVNAIEAIAAKARPQKVRSWKSGFDPQQCLSAQETTSLSEALREGCYVLESLLSESQHRQYQLACWQDSLELLVQGQISEAEALVRTISALQLSNSSSNHFAALCHIKRGLLQYQTLYEKQRAVQDQRPTQSYTILEETLESHASTPQTLGTLRVDADTQIPVYIEWRTIEENPWNTAKLLRQIQDLSAILGSESAHILKLLTCRGVVYRGYEQGSFRCGLVYDLPPGARADKHQPLQTLYRLINSSFRPSLSSRFELARDLATGLLYLHSVGWLHKEIRSSNVLLFPPLMSQRKLANSRLMGLAYARSGHEELQHQSTKPKDDFDLWRHPQYQKNKQATKYCQAFDIYSLGLVLFEIGRWKALDQTYSTLRKADEREVHLANFGARLQEREVPKDVWGDLEYHTGETYARVVSSCISHKVDTFGNEELISFMLNEVVLVLDRLVAHT